MEAADPDVGDARREPRAIVGQDGNAALRDNEDCTGSSWDMPHFYPAPLRKKARALLDEGARLAAAKGIAMEASMRLNRKARPGNRNLAKA